MRKQQTRRLLANRLHKQVVFVIGLSPRIDGGDVSERLAIGCETGAIFPDTVFGKLARFAAAQVDPPKFGRIAVFRNRVEPLAHDQVAAIFGKRIALDQASAREYHAGFPARHVDPVERVGIGAPERFDAPFVCRVVIGLGIAFVDQRAPVG